jgi:hypothetical protein
MIKNEKNRPFCECHKEPMWWAKDKRRLKGGYWYCQVNRKLKERKWRENNKDKVKIYKKKSDRNYYLKNRDRVLNKVKQYRKNNIEKIRANDIIRCKQYRDSPRGFITRRTRELNQMREGNLQRLKKLQEDNPWLMN